MDTKFTSKLYAFAFLTFLDAFFGRQSYSTSLASSVREYKMEHGRRFHAFREGAYNFPNDDKEQDRLDMVHHMQMLAKDKKLFLAPLSAPPKRILDVGTGYVFSFGGGDGQPPM